MFSITILSNSRQTTVVEEGYDNEGFSMAVWKLRNEKQRPSCGKGGLSAKSRRVQRPDPGRN
jgi:hypothetical protein